MFDSQRVLFQLPVYRLSFDQWLEDERQRAEPHFHAHAQYRPEPEARILAEMITDRRPWAFNEVIAWIEVDGFHDVIKAYLWRRKGQRQHRHPSQPFDWVGKLTEHWIVSEDRSGHLSTVLKQELLDAVRTTPGLASRFVDFSTYDNVAPYFDWHAALIACESRSRSL